MTTTNLKPGTPFATAQAAGAHMTQNLPWFSLRHDTVWNGPRWGAVAVDEEASSYYAPAIPADDDGLVHGTMTDPVTGESRPMTYQADKPFTTAEAAVLWMARSEN